MKTKQEIMAEIDKVPDEDLEELFRLIRRFSSRKTEPDQSGIMAKLQGVKIEAPADFAAQFDLYANGEKSVDSNIP